MPLEFSRGVYARGAKPLCGVALSSALAFCLGNAVIAQQPEPSTPQSITITLLEGADSRPIQTSAATVGELLSEEKAALDTDDRCSVPLSTPLRDGLRIRVTRIETRQTVERIPLAPPVKPRKSSALRAGERQIVQAGEPGEIAKTLLTIVKDGKIVQRKKIAEVVTAPVPQIVATGTRAVLASRGFYAGRRVLEMVATGYGPGARSNGRWASRTASGLRPGYGVVAVDPRVIPLGTRLYIPGYGYAVAGDTGGAIKGNRIDLGHDTHQEAVQVGRKRVQVYILD